MKKVVTIVLAALIVSFPVILQAEGFPEIEGWRPESDVKIYGRDDLWEYIDGAAEQFVMYGFQMLRFRVFSKGALKMTTEIYDMGSPLNAFGIYTTERPADGKRLHIGTEAVTGPYLCLLLKDRYYIKIMMLKGMLDDGSGEALLKAIEPELTGDPLLPPQLDSLPTQGRVSGSEKYVTHAYMGLSELKNVLFADYKNTKEDVCRYFYVIPTPEETAEQIWKRLSVKWKSGRVGEHIVLHRDIPYEGKIGIIHTGKGILGVSGVPDETELYARLSDII